MQGWAIPAVGRSVAAFGGQAYRRNNLLPGAGSMAVFRIAVIGGDGIGPEVIDEAIRRGYRGTKLDNTELKWNRLPWSTAY